MYFKDLLCNVFLFDRPHEILLISTVAKKYINIRLHSFGKLVLTEVLNPVSNKRKSMKHNI